MPKDKPTIDELLDDVPAKKSRSTLASMPDLVEHIKDFLRLKVAGDERAHVSLNWFYRSKLQPLFSGPSMDVVRRYVRDELRLDIVTGEPL